jgi:thiol-disulfide isomerase/thioredoxin
MRWILLAAGALALAGGGFAVGRWTAPPPKGYVDLSAASPSFRGLLANKDTLAMLGELIQPTEEGGVKVVVADKAPILKLPEGYPAWPGFSPLRVPKGSARWMGLKVAGGQNLAANGRWTVVNVWATWCAPCVAELPDLNVLSEKLAGRVDVYTINLDLTGKDTLASVNALFDAKGYANLPRAFVAVDAADPLLAATGMSRKSASYPTTVIYAPDGKAFAELNGPPDDRAGAWTSPEMLAFFGKLAAHAGPPA